MPGIAVVLIGFVLGILTMTVVSMYKWVLKDHNNKIR
jgi:hypothetical protein